jgi:hypothetical protein
MIYGSQQKDEGKHLRLLYLFYEKHITYFHLNGK